ncbi:MAG: hypothetical protein ACFNM7_07415 [Prevotella conceptionensis]
MGDKVLIRITGQKTGDSYLAKSYPDEDYDNDGWNELYEVPVYYIDIINMREPSVTRRWKCLRFMPYWNDPALPSPRYRLQKWTVAGLSERKEPFQATYYDATYNTSNSPSPHKGAIQIQNSFLIHSGPSSLQDDKWGSAGCVEIIGNFSDFKEDIKTVSGIGGYLPSDEVIFKLIKAGKLYIEIEAADKPSITPMSNQYKFKIQKR